MPLSDEQAREFLRRAKADGVPDEVAIDTLAETMREAPAGLGRDVQMNPAPYGGPSAAPPWADVERSQKQEQVYRGVGKAALGAGIVGASAYLGGLPAMAAAPEGYGVLAGIAGQTAGAYGGELLRQGVMGEKFSQRKARESAIMTGGSGLGMYGLTKVLGAAGGVPSAATEYVGTRSKAIPRYDLTMGEPAAGAELKLGRQVGKEVSRQGRNLTPGRVAEEAYINQATQAGTRIDPQPVIDALKAKMLKTPRTRVGRNTNRRLKELVDSLDASKAQGGMTPDELDELIGGELDPSIYASGKASGKMVSKRLAPAREQAKESLLKPLPPEARMERTRAAQELSRREMAEGYFGEQRGGKAISTEISNLFKPGNEEALESLRGIGREAGIDFETMARELSVKRAFNADDRLKSSILHRIMLSIGTVGLATGRPAYAAAALASQPAVARTGAKVTAPLQTLIGPAGATMAQYYRQKYPIRTTPESPAPMWSETRVSPSKVANDFQASAFPGMTNP